MEFKTMDNNLKKINTMAAMGRPANILHLDEFKNSDTLCVVKDETGSIKKIIEAIPFIDHAAAIQKTERQLAEFKDRERKLEEKFQEYQSNRNFSMAESTEKLRKQREADVSFTQSKLDSLRAGEPVSLQNYIEQAKEFILEIENQIIGPVKEKIKSAELRLKEIGAGKK